MIARRIILYMAKVVLVLHPIEVIAASLYADRSTFENNLGSYVIDDYHEELYKNGDLSNHEGYHRFSDGAMSAILGETKYSTTGHDDSNQVTTGYAANNGNFAYCAGCNGSFMMQFDSTSVGNSDGVYGVAFDMYYNYLSDSGDYWWPFPSNTEGYHAYVTFGDGTTYDYELPVAAPIDSTTAHPSFWAITSKKYIKSVHIGDVNGGVARKSSFVMDNLTIGSASPVPLPAASWLFLGGMAIIGRIACRKSFV